MKINYLILLIIIGIISACKKDNPESANNNGFNIDPSEKNQVEAISPNFNTLDGSEVSSKIEIEGATRINGKPDFDPKNIHDSKNIRTVNSKTLDLEISNSGTKIEGVYIIIKGSTDYFDLPAKLLKSKEKPVSSSKHISTRIIQSNNELLLFFLSLYIPSDLPEGKFCVFYSTYDSEKNIINTQERCIEVQNPGGYTALHGTWNFKSASFFIEGEIISIQPGEPFSYHLFPSTETKDCYYIENNTIDTKNYTFNSNGNYLEYNKGTKTRIEIFINDSSATCNKTNYYEDETSTGMWSYDQVKKTLVLIYESHNVIPNFQEYRVRLNESKLTLSYIQPFEDMFFSFVINMEKK